MKAVVWHAAGDIRIDDVDEPRIQAPTDAIVRLTASALCGTDLPVVRGTMAGMRPGTILGHEGVGVVEEVGRPVRQRQPRRPDLGHHVLRRARGGRRPRRPAGREGAHPVRARHLRQAPRRGRRRRRNPAVGHLPDRLVRRAAGRDHRRRHGRPLRLRSGGPVRDPQRAAAGRRVSREDPVEALRRLTGGSGPDRVVDAVGVDAESPGADRDERFAREVEEVAPDTPDADSPSRPPGDAPSQALRWEVEAVAKGGTLAVIGVYPPQAEHFPIGQLMNKNLTLKAGNCNHRRYVPEVVELVRSGVVRPSEVLTQVEELTGALDAYEDFDRREAGWHKVAFDPAVTA